LKNVYFTILNPKIHWFFLKNLLANSSFLVFPNKNFRNFGFFGVIT
jgi:hypothetical protein